MSSGHATERSFSHRDPRRVVHGHKRPDDHLVLTDNERTWISFIRDIAEERDPVPTLAAIHALRLALTGI